MTTSTPCTVKLLNKTYTVKCPENESDNLQLAATKLEAQLQVNKTKYRQLSEFENMLLAALYISHELVTCEKKQAAQRHQVTEFISSLENKINQVVNGDAAFDPQTD
ncbi:cell division protein ZapA [Legionella sp. CNM-4043-24]|uniref:cell division protein ZapA n=1 Tax=Legionella sp. CNM-4043-24 TaxID=3421646 RepID=UPI00403B2D01